MLPTNTARAHSLYTALCLDRLSGLIQGEVGPGLTQGEAWKDKVRSLPFPSDPETYVGRGFVLWRKVYAWGLPASVLLVTQT